MRTASLREIRRWPQDAHAAPRVQHEQVGFAADAWATEQAGYEAVHCGAERVVAEQHLRRGGLQVKSDLHGVGDGLSGHHDPLSRGTRRRCSSSSASSRAGGQ